MKKKIAKDKGIIKTKGLLDYTDGYIDGLMQGQEIGMELTIKMIQKMGEKPNTLDLDSKQMKK